MQTHVRRLVLLLVTAATLIGAAPPKTLASVEQRLSTIVVPWADFHDLLLHEILRILEMRSMELDREGTGISSEQRVDR